MTKKEPKKQNIENLDESAFEDELVKLREEFEITQQRISESEEKYKRALADYQNLQKRSYEDRQEWIRSANKELLLRILTILDTMILAYQHSQDKNLQISINHFLDILKSEGVTRIETAGQEFSPVSMEAIATAEGEEGKVIAETRAGFMLHDKLLRAAQVTVGKNG